MKRTLSIGASAAMALAIVSGGAALAHDAPRPAHIHTGACPAPGDVIAPLTDLTVSTGDASGATTAIPVESSSTTVELALADILAADHAFVVHHAADDMGTYLVCGDIGGTTMDTEMGTGLAVGLAPVGDSTFSGVGLLHDNGDGTTGVELFITDWSGMMDDTMDAEASE